MRFMQIRISLPCFLLAISGTAGAVDGVLEVNQACAVNTGCFSGDTAGYPVTITTPGSYRLTSNLKVPDENTSGVIINTSNAAIDLNGFTIIRSDCESLLNDCSLKLGTGRGVTSENTAHVSVRNGVIVGMGNFGVALHLSSKVMNLQVRSNNGGIHVDKASIVVSNTAYGNGDVGIEASEAAIISVNTALENNGRGINVGPGSIVSGNLVSENDLDGIQASTGSNVSGNTVLNNGRSGTGFGLSLSSAAYRDNVITNTSSSTTGTVQGGVDAGGNVCNGSLGCP